MFGKYKVAHLLGLTRKNEDAFRFIERELTKQGFICFCPAIYNYDVYLDNMEMINDMCYEKLLVCDFCVIVTPDHIGESTYMRIKQAEKLGKPVFTFQWNRLVPYNDASKHSDIYQEYVNKIKKGEGD